jgi:biopolymer transport protein ExbD
MRIPTRPRRLGLRFNITPLIDVVFLLIIFFLVASHFVRHENLEAVELPEATETDDEAEQSPRRLIVTITEDLRMQVAGKPADRQAVEQMILTGREEHRDRFEVRIRADRSVPYSEVEPIMLACARAGVTDVKFAVIQK